MSMELICLFGQAPQGPQEPVSLIPLYVILAYLSVLFGVGVVSTWFFRGTSSDYFVASRSIGPFMLLMSLFGTTMTAFALVGSTAKAYDAGIGTYGLMASSSGLIHAACFFLIGIKMWAIGKRHGYITQIQFFKDRFESPFLGYLLFPILVGLIIPYLLVGLIGSGSYIGGVTRGMFPETFEGGAIPPWLTALVISVVVLFYVFFGGVRSTAWANTFQTIVFMIMGVVGFYLIARSLGGPVAASEATMAKAPEKLSRTGLIGQLHFLTYMLVPLSVGMFPHLFQHWLTAKSAKAFRLTVIAHPLCIMIVWVPCVLIGVWAAGQTLPPSIDSSNKVLGFMVNKHISSQVIEIFGIAINSKVVVGLFSAGVLAAIMSSLDSQFVCIGSMFTNDFVIPLAGKRELDDRTKMMCGRFFVILIVAITFVISIFRPMNVFNLGVWCFSGFAALFPLAVAAIYWKRTTRAGALACVVVTMVVWATLFWDALFNKPGEQLFGQTDPVTKEYLVLEMMPVAFIVLASVVALIGVSLITKPLKNETIDKFFSKV